MKTNNSQISLTPEELEFINKKREEETAKKKEAQVKVDSEKEEQLKYKLKEAETFKSKQESVKQKTEEYFKEIESKYPGKYKLVTNELTKDFEGSIYVSNDTKEILNLKNGDLKFFVTQVTFTSLKIVLIENNNYYIIVDEYNVKVERYKTTKELRLFVHGCGFSEERKALKTITTAHKNITDHYASIKRENQQKSDSSKSYDMIEAYCKETHPEATITRDVNYDSRSSYRDIVKVVFSNGLILNYFNSYTVKDNEIKIFTNPKVDTSKMDQKVLIETLKSL